MLIILQGNFCLLFLLIYLFLVFLCCPGVPLLILTKYWNHEKKFFFWWKYIFRLLRLEKKKFRAQWFLKASFERSTSDIEFSIKILINILFRFKFCGTKPSFMSIFNILCIKDKDNVWEFNILYIKYTCEIFSTKFQCDPNPEQDSDVNKNV